MTKTKVVINVSMNGNQIQSSYLNKCLKPIVPCLFQPTNSREKIMKIAAILPGVDNVSIDAEKNLLTVIGLGIDSTELVNILRKKVGYAYIASQNPEPVEKKEEKPPPADKKENKEEPIVINLSNNRAIPMVEMWEIRDPYNNNNNNNSCFPFL